MQKKVSDAGYEGQVTPVSSDVSDAKDREKIVEAVPKDTTGLLLVHSAGRTFCSYFAVSASLCARRITRSRIDGYGLGNSVDSAGILS